MNYKELRIAEIRAGYNNNDVAHCVGISKQAFYNKIAGRTDFKSSEIKKISAFLKLSPEDVNRIFFDGMVN